MLKLKLGKRYKLPEKKHKIKLFCVFKYKDMVDQSLNLNAFLFFL